MMPVRTHKSHRLSVAIMALLPWLVIAPARADLGAGKLGPYELRQMIVHTLDQFGHWTAEGSADRTDANTDVRLLRKPRSESMALRLLALAGGVPPALPCSATAHEPPPWANSGRRHTSAVIPQVLRCNGPVQTAAQSPPNAHGRLFAATQQGPFDDLILAAAQRWQLDPFLLKGLLANESRLDPITTGKKRYGRRNGRRIVISGGAIGIAQFTRAGIGAVNALRRRRWRQGQPALRYSTENARIPQEAIPAAAELLAHLTDLYGRDGGITAYNSGAAGGIAVSRLGFWGALRSGKLERVGIYPIQGYRFLLNVLRRTNEYRQLAGLGPLEAPAALRVAAAPAAPPPQANSPDIVVMASAHP